MVIKHPATKMLQSVKWGPSLISTVAVVTYSSVKWHYIQSEAWVLFIVSAEPQLHLRTNKYLCYQWFALHICRTICVCKCVSFGSNNHSTTCLLQTQRHIDTRADHRRGCVPRPRVELLHADSLMPHELQTLVGDTGCYRRSLALWMCVFCVSAAGRYLIYSPPSIKKFTKLCCFNYCGWQ